MGLLRKVKELLAEVDARTLAQHVTKVDCLVGAGYTLGQEEHLHPLALGQGSGW